jgi:hypothetical protein
LQRGHEKALIAPLLDLGLLLDLGEVFGVGAGQRQISSRISGSG